MLNTLLQSLTASLSFLSIIKYGATGLADILSLYFPHIIHLLLILSTCLLDLENTYTGLYDGLEWCGGL